MLINMHIPVLLKETIDLLNVKEDGRYIDATLGLGGHSIEIIKQGGRVLGIEINSDSLAEARGRLQKARLSKKAVLVQGNFKELKKIALKTNLIPCDGVFFDLGMSSWQLEESGRGFSFRKEEPLDMRMDKSLSVTAADLLNGLGRDELAKLFQKYGEEQSARRIASAIVRARTLKSFETTGELVQIVEGIKGRRGKRKIHPATKVFQALRIAVNNEIDNLRSALPQAFEILVKGGRLVVIAFHSLEDREVKRFFQKLEREDAGELITRKPIIPPVQEIKVNPRARSAKLRAIEKVKGRQNA